MYRRIVILLPQYEDKKKRHEYLVACHEAQCALVLTVTFSAEDAGNVAGCWNEVIAVNPQDIGDGLSQDWFNARYADTRMHAVTADSPGDLAAALQAGISLSEAEGWLIPPRFTCTPSA